MVGVGIHFWSLDYPVSYFRSWDKKPVSLTGYVIERDGKYFLTRIEGFPVYSPSVLLRGKGFTHLGYSRGVFSGVFRKFVSCVNPGGVDQRLQWWKKRVVGYLEVKDFRAVSGHSLWFTLLHWVEERKQRLLSLWQEQIGNEASLFAALFLGEKDTQFFHQKDSFEHMGVYHLFCVSGFHLTLLGGMTLLVLKQFLILRPFSAFLLIVFSFLYLLFCSLVPSAFRSFLMLSFYLLGKWFGRKVPSGGIFWAAFLSMMVIQPEMLLNGGAQLSFASTWGLVVVLRLLEGEGQRHGFIQTIIRENLLLGLAVYSTSLPFLMIHRFSFSSLFLLGNIILLPLTEGVLFLAFWGTPFIWFFPIRRGVAIVLRFLLRNILFLTQFFTTRLPHFFLDFSRSGDLVWGVWVFTGVLVVTLGSILKAKRTKALCFLLLFPISVTPFLLLPAREFWVFDVGQGLACGIVEKQTISFIDLGGVIRGYNLVGETILKRFLWYRDIREIRNIFLTHWHKDHVAGLDVFTSSSRLSLFAPENLEKGGIPFVPIKWPTRFQLTDQVTVQVFPIRGETENDQALVYLVVFPDMRILVTGDIEERGIDELLRCGKSITAEVVILPHHGKYYPNLAELLSRTGCHTVIISCGENEYGHPDRRTLEMVQKAGWRSLITQQDGAIRIYPFLGKWRVRGIGKRNL
ncbi:MAG: ComEC/Rec2 family competence protein [Atribacterota bacterium]